MPTIRHYEEGDRLPVVVWNLDGYVDDPVKHALSKEEVETAVVVDLEELGYVALKMTNGAVHIVYNVDLE